MAEKKKFQWYYKNQHGKGLTKKAKAYLRLTYKNQHSQGELYNNKKRAKSLISKSKRTTINAISKEVKKKAKKKKIPRRKKEKQRKITEPRTRKQKVANYRTNKNPYYISIRVITINPQITDRGLMMALRKLKKKLTGQKIYLTRKGTTTDKINFSNFTGNLKSSVGSERQRISVNEDKILNDYKIHYEILIGRNKPITGTIDT